MRIKSIRRQEHENAARFRDNHICFDEQTNLRPFNKEIPTLVVKHSTETPTQHYAELGNMLSIARHFFYF